ncbi:thioredoxin-like protein [Maribacter caenipelagi]|uniref:Thioredoxin-like protein n=2 Tax=Maribacter TaxID=252356 RepID=A0A4R7D8D9_9FLAO|nr:thioredoxin fold domain-containing protein [Maribacter caenipelagi]TDS16662.1 thioredoxin-like protein [Maribacter caenipelagi]
METNASNNTPKLMKTKSHPFWRWFWLTFLVVSLWYAWYSFYVPSNDMVWNDDMVSAQKLADSSDKNIMLFFTGEWCSPCRIMKREIFGDKEAMNAINAKVIPVEINIDDPNVKELAKHYNIGATPTTVFIDSEGNVIDYAVGKVGRTKFLEILKNLNLP